LGKVITVKRNEGKALSIRKRGFSLGLGRNAQEIELPSEEKVGKGSRRGRGRKAVP